MVSASGKTVWTGGGEHGRAVLLQVGLVAFGDHQVISAPIQDRLGYCALREQGIHRHHPPGQHKAPQHLRCHGDLVGLVVHGRLAQGQPQGLADDAPQVGSRCALCAAAAQGFAVQRPRIHGQGRGQHRFGPAAQHLLEGGPIQRPEHQEQRRRAGCGGPREAQRAQQVGVIGAAPLGDGAIGAGAAQDRAQANPRRAGSGYRRPCRLRGRGPPRGPRSMVERRAPYRLLPPASVRLT